MEPSGPQGGVFFLSSSSAPSSAPAALHASASDPNSTPSQTKRGSIASSEQPACRDCGARFRGVPADCTPELLESSDDELTLGQYLAPTLKHIPVARFVPPEEFTSYATVARTKGFLLVSASPLTRSSYHAGEDFKKLQAVRKKMVEGRGEMGDGRWE